MGDDKAQEEREGWGARLWVCRAWPGQAGRVPAAAEPARDPPCLCCSLRDGDHPAELRGTREGSEPADLRSQALETPPLTLGVSSPAPIRTGTAFFLKKPWRTLSP